MPSSKEQTLSVASVSFLFVCLFLRQLIIESWSNITQIPPIEI